MRLSLRKHKHSGWPRNDTVGDHGYDPAKWAFVCAECGARESVPVEKVVHKDGGVSMPTPESWR